MVTKCSASQQLPPSWEIRALEKLSTPWGWKVLPVMGQALCLCNYSFPNSPLSSQALKVTAHLLPFPNSRPSLNLMRSKWDTEALNLKHPCPWGPPSC